LIVQTLLQQHDINDARSILDTAAAAKTDPATAQPTSYLSSSNKGPTKAWLGSQAGTRTHLIREWQIGQPSLQGDQEPALVFAKFAKYLVVFCKMAQFAITHPAFGAIKLPTSFSNERHRPLHSKEPRTPTRQDVGVVPNKCIV
jgi:hypothetical protein